MARRNNDERVGAVPNVDSPAAMQEQTTNTENTTGGALNFVVPTEFVDLPSGGVFYGLMLLPFNGRLLQMVRRLAQDPDNLTKAKGLFRWSILYLFGICLLLILSRTSLATSFDQQVWMLLGEITLR